MDTRHCAFVKPHRTSEKKQSPSHMRVRKLGGPRRSVTSNLTALQVCVSPLPRGVGKRAAWATLETSGVWETQATGWDPPWWSCPTRGGKWRSWHCYACILKLNKHLAGGTSFSPWGGNLQTQAGGQLQQSMGKEDSREVSVWTHV